MAYPIHNVHLSEELQTRQKDDANYKDSMMYQLT
jgi:hypothetical protein